jgi:hypothetical protein
MTINYNNEKNKLKRKEGKGSRALYTRGWPETRLSNTSKPKRDHARAVILLFFSRGLPSSQNKIK